LVEKVNRPFLFGPIDFEMLNLDDKESPFDHEAIRKRIVSELQKTPYLPSELCLHGFKVCIKNKTLKRRSTIVKHSRFMRNLQVYPIFPPEPIVVVAENEGEVAEEEDED
jgi:hypothetical protein